MRLHPSTGCASIAFADFSSSVSKASTTSVLGACKLRQSWVVDGLLTTMNITRKHASTWGCRRKLVSTALSPRQSWVVDRLLMICVDARHICLHPATILGCRRIEPVLRGDIRLHMFFVPLFVPTSITLAQFRKLAGLQVICTNHLCPLPGLLSV
jgi:hypothetical protein